MREGVAGVAWGSIRGAHAGQKSTCRGPSMIRGMPFLRAQGPVVAELRKRVYFASAFSCFAMIIPLIFAYSFLVTTFLLTRSAFDL